MMTSKRPPVYEKQNPQSAGSLNYRRNEGRIHTKKLQRKIKLRFRHIFLSFILLAGFFFVLQQVFLFAISWDKLEIKDNKTKLTLGNSQSAQGSYLGSPLDD